MAEITLSSADIAYLRRLPETVEWRSHGPVDRARQARMRNLQRARIIRVIPRTNQHVGAGLLADVVLTDLGRAALARAA